MNTLVSLDKGTAIAIIPMMAVFAIIFVGVSVDTYLVNRRRPK